MAKEDFILEEGVVVEALPNTMFRIEVPGYPDLILGHLSGKMRRFSIKVLPGDRVIFEMSPYDLTKGRITRRLKPGEPGLRGPAVETPAESTESVAETEVVTPATDSETGEEGKNEV